jgi:membrane-bound lytic murein transglycosylase D
VIKRSGQAHPSYWEVGLPSETRDYVPRIYAAAVLSKNPAAHGFNIVPWSPFPIDTFTVDGGLTLQKIAEALHCNADTLVTLNPALTRKMTPPRKDSYLLKLPAGTRDAFAMIYPSLEKSYNAPEPSRWVHRIRKGETIGSIASRYGVSSQEIRAWNHLGKRKIRPGKTLVIYGDPTDSRIASEETTSSRKRKRGASSSDDDDAAAVSGTHRVRSGETIASIASRYKTTAAAIKNANHLRSNSVRVGQKLRIPAPAAASGESVRSRKDTAKSSAKAAAKTSTPNGTRNYRVKKGDSLFSIAKQASTTVEEILSINGMKNNRIRPGQVLKLPTGG